MGQPGAPGIIVITYTPFVTTAPSAPTSLSASGGVGQISLTWQAPSSNGGSAITGYKIYRSTSPIPDGSGGSENVIFLTSGTSWTVPNDWNSSNNTIECIGGGAGGQTAAQYTSGGGGGGGAYSAVNNLSLTPGNAITIQVGSGGGASTNGGDTWISTNGSTPTTIAQGCLAKGGASGGVGGNATSGVGTTKYSGGTGGATAHGGSGGGGAAGPSGAGAAGGTGSATGSLENGSDAGGGGGGANGGSVGVAGSGAGGGSTTAGGPGGNNRLGTGGGASGSGAGSGGGGGGGGSFIPCSGGGPGGAGSQDTIWTQTSNGATAGPGSGAGGGGGGAIHCGPAGNGGSATAGYGGGGGGAGTAGIARVKVGGPGAPGIIVVRYTPSSSPLTPYATVGSVTTYTDTSVTVGTTYYYRVKATNSVGDSAYSNEDSTAATAPCLPGSSGGNVYGWAWSETIGWISLNASNSGTCTSQSYGLNIASDGTMSGYAWSENIGWISANASDLSGCPASPCTARMNGSNMQGWMKVLAANQAQSAWDGWISLSGTSPNYGPTISNGVISGYAWGDTNLGWIAFNTSLSNATTTWVACTPTYQCTSETTRDNLCTTGIVENESCGSGLICSTGQCVIPPAPTPNGANGALKISPRLIRSGGTTRVSWNIRYADSCTVTEDNPQINDSWTGSTGSYTSSAIGQQTIYTLSCTGPGGSLTQRATVYQVPSWKEL